MEFYDINAYLTDKNYRSNFITEIGSTVVSVIYGFTNYFKRIRSDYLYVFWPALGKISTGVGSVADQSTCPLVCMD